MIYKKKQRGYLLLVAVILIVIVSFVAGAFVYMVSTASESKIQYLSTKQSFSTAISGIEYVTSRLRDAAINDRLACRTLSTTQTFGHGQADVTNDGTSGYPRNSNNILLSATINASTTNIPIINVTNFADQGKIQIDREIITYTGKSGNTLTNAKRGQDGTLATSHARRTRVSQYQCNLLSQGYSPSKTNINGVTTLASSTQLQEGWALGGKWWDNPKFTRWNSPVNQNAWSYTSGLPSNTGSLPRAISMINYVDGWVVGPRPQLGGTTKNVLAIWRRSPSNNNSNDNWARVNMNGILFADDEMSGGIPQSQYITDLLGVSSVTTNDAWAVGARSKFSPHRYTIMHWAERNPKNPFDPNLYWCKLSASTTPQNQRCSRYLVPNPSGSNRDLDAISVIRDTNGNDFGFAVGSYATVLKLDTSVSNNWVHVSVPISGNWTLQSTHVTSRNDAWIVGWYPWLLGTYIGVILHWNGSTWSRRYLFFYRLNGVDAIASNDVWAVGEFRFLWIFYDQIAIHYNGSSWSIKPSPVTWRFPWNDVHIFSHNDVWAVGGRSRGQIAHYDGSSWDRRFTFPTIFYAIGGVKIPQTSQQYKRTTRINPL